jgi:transcriptional regulator with XRE-family HTH domain
MNAGSVLREARERAGLTQADLARHAGTSQATISAYELGIKDPSVGTLSRLLALSGARLTVEAARARVVEPGAAQRRRTSRVLLDVLALAEALPAQHEPTLRYPRLPPPRGA